MAEYKFLDFNGLGHFWTKIKAYVDNAIKVTGVKGNSESTYRTGNVNLTSANIGALAVAGSSATNPVSNLNSFYTGIGLFNSDVTNNPFGDWCLVVSGGANGTTTQVAYALSNGLMPKARYCAGGTWSSWDNLTTSTLVSSSVTFLSGITAGSVNTLRRKGNTVSLTCRFTTPSTATSGLQIATIPTGYRPTITMYVAGIKTWERDSNPPVAISSNGTISFINVAYATSADYIVSATWLTNEAYPS